MTHLARQSSKHAQPVFTDAAKPPVRHKAKKPPPFSLRLNAEERQRLETAAADMPLGSYIKARLFDGDLSPRRTRGRAPVKDHAALAQVLGMIGNMRLASNLNQLAKSANIGTLPLTPDVEEELASACAAVIAMRVELMRALGYESEDET